MEAGAIAPDAVPVPDPTLRSVEMVTPQTIELLFTLQTLNPRPERVVPVPDPNLVPVEMVALSTLNPHPAKPSTRYTRKPQPAKLQQVTAVTYHLFDFLRQALTRQTPHPTAGKPQTRDTRLRARNLLPLSRLGVD